METEFKLPVNKSKINNKHKTKDAIKTAIDNILKQENIEGDFSDENWLPIQKLQNILDNHGIQFHLLDVDYEGHGEAKNSNLPTKKVYRFVLNVRDREGKNVSLYLKVICAFVGHTGTMADKEYKLAYHFF